MSNGIGGDAFAIVWFKDKLYGLNGSGYSPENINIDKIKDMGYDKMPKSGWIPITIPGQPKAWADLVNRFGNLTLKENLQPAINYAKNGFVVSPTIGVLWEKYLNKHLNEYSKSSVFDEWFNTFTNDKKAYEFGDLVKFPNHAKTLELIGSTNAESFYKGEIAKKIVDQSVKEGGFLSLKDLRDYETQWVEPISINYKGYDIWEIPPNGQGLVALMTLNILNNCDFEERENSKTYHKMFEAMKMGFSDGFKIITDPNDMKQDVNEYLCKQYGLKRSNEIEDRAKHPDNIDPYSSGTVYLCAADKDGNMVSYIQSNYMDFGSGIVVKDYGISLQNRGADFSLDKNAVNALKPKKRSYHTIIPGFITKGNKPICAFGVMGGYMQPQGHVQVVTNLIDFKLNPQMALDAPRWQWKRGKSFIVEPEFDKKIVDELIKMGHEVSFANDRYSFGRGQIILFDEKGFYVGGVESRADSNICSY